MKLISVSAAILFGCAGLFVLIDKKLPYSPCWCWPHNLHIFAKQKTLNEGIEYMNYGSYGSEADWNNPQQVIPLNYEQTQGKRIFYEKCVWCHADSTPAGPSNRSNVSPEPPLMNDGTTLNTESDASLHRIIAFGGPTAGKSAMMPPYGLSLRDEEIDDLVAFIRVIATPQYHKPTTKSSWVWGNNH
jgi:mono/diheme cytochrome c family protein